MLLPVPVEIVWESKAHIKDDKVMMIAQRLSALGTGMTLEELCDLVRFVELLRSSNECASLYLRKEETKAPRTVEVDPHNKRIFIHLKTHNIPEIGRGHHKKVTHSILYDQVSPKLVASAVVKDSEGTRAEIELFEKFKGSKGILEPLYISKHPKTSGKMLRQIVTPLYNKGSLNTFVKNNPNAIPIEAKFRIAKDIFVGSCEINAMGYVNRDNNKGNFLIHEENNVYKTVIGDLGGYTHKLKEALERKPLGPSMRSSAPDLQRAYYENRLSEQDLLSQHVYSLGRSLYFLLHEDEVPWISAFDENYPLLAKLYKDKSNPDIVNELDRYTEEVNANTKPRIQELAIKIQQQTIQPRERFEYYVLHMLSADPELRKTNAYWLKIFETFCQTEEA